MGITAPMGKSVPTVGTGVPLLALVGGVGACGRRYEPASARKTRKRGAGASTRAGAAGGAALRDA